MIVMLIIFGGFALLSIAVTIAEKVHDKNLRKESGILAESLATHIYNWFAMGTTPNVYMLYTSFKEKIVDYDTYIKTLHMFDWKISYAAVELLGGDIAKAAVSAQNMEDFAVSMKLMRSSDYILNRLKEE